MTTDSTHAPRVHFITFGNGVYAAAVQRLTSEIRRACPWAASITGYTDAHLRADLDFWRNQGLWVLTNKPGFGYWIWKPWLIKKTLASVPDGDIVVYMDAGCTFNPRGAQRMQFYLNAAKEHGLVSFQMPHAEQDWTKQAVFDTVCPPEQLDAIRKSGQFVGGIQILHKRPSTIALIDEWWTICSTRHDLVDNSNSMGCKEHRHDQSICSVLKKIHGAGLVLPDETWYPNFNSIEALDKPIWATRKR